MVKCAANRVLISLFSGGQPSRSPYMRLSNSNSACPSCLTNNGPDALFCAKCGNVLRSPDHQRQQRRALIITGLILVGIVWLSTVYRGTPSSSTDSAVAVPSPERATPISSHDRLIRAHDSIHAKDFSSALAQIELIPPTAPEFAEAKKLKPIAQKGAEALERERAPQLRETLRIEYESLLSEANPHLNFIGSKLTKIKGGYALWATHEYFSQFTFSIGSDAKIVQSWISLNDTRLRDAGIVRVGVMGRGSYASWNYFDLR
jgi:predicted nucleic acid-binding Zn ribbon protein